jgi:hypothetical protein
MRNLSFDQVGFILRSISLEEPSPTKVGIIRVLRERSGFEGHIGYLTSNHADAHADLLSDLAAYAALSIDTSWYREDTLPHELPGQTTSTRHRELWAARYLHPLKKPDAAKNDLLSPEEGVLGVGNATLPWLLSAKEILGKDGNIVWSPNLFTFVAMVVFGRAFDDQGNELAPASEVADLEVVLSKDSKDFSIDQKHVDELRVMQNEPHRKICEQLLKRLKQPLRGGPVVTWDIPLTQGAELCFQLQCWPGKPSAKLKPGTIVVDDRGKLKPPSMPPRGKEIIEKIAEELRTKKRSSFRVMTG